MQRKSKFVEIVKAFVQRLDLVPVWEYHPIDYSHIHTDNHSVSTLDHFLISPRLLHLINGCGVVHVGDNMSRHSPIWLREGLKKNPDYFMTLIKRVGGYLAEITTS